MDKAKAHVVVDIVAYLPKAVVGGTIIRKTTGNITAKLFCEWQGVA